LTGFRLLAAVFLSAVFLSLACFFLVFFLAIRAVYHRQMRAHKSELRAYRKMCASIEHQRCIPLMIWVRTMPVNPPGPVTGLKNGLRPPRTLSVSEFTVY
jgi:hypothetical protein